MSADPPSSSGLPPRSRPVLSDLSKHTTEEDLWDLDEESSQGETSIAPESAPVRPAPAKERPRANVIESRLDKADAKRKEAAPGESVGDPAPQADEPDSAQAAPLAPPADNAAPSAGPSTQDEPAGEWTQPKGEQKPAASDAPAVGARFGINRRELIGLGAFFLAILTAAIWGIASFFNHLHFTDSEAGLVEFPVKGERATVVTAESFWREPIRTGSNRDAARGDVAVIPVVEISLEPGSGSGALRILFHNDRGTPVGDTITRTFSNGRFDIGGSERTECASSAGFEQRGEFNALRAGQTDPWTVLVLEGPGPDAPAREFRTLFEMPLSTLFR